jgi:hypothetical protein
VDDFIGAAQGTRTHLEDMRRVLFEAVDRVFRPLEVENGEGHREEPVSLKKQLKADGAWSNIGPGGRHGGHVHPPHRKETGEVDEILNSLNMCTKDRLNVKAWHKVLGELHSMSLAIPGSRGLFGILQEALGHTTGGPIHITAAIDDLLDNF